MELRELSIAPGFFVSSSGDVFDKNGNKRPVYRNGDSYLGVSVKTLAGRWTTFGVQRLVAMCFVPNIKPGVRNQVNHFDGNKENNDWKNLEWVTDRENQIHADLFSTTSVRKRIVLRHRKNVIQKYFVRSLLEAAQLTGLTTKEIWEAIKEDWFSLVWDIEYVPHNSKIPSDVKLPKIKKKANNGTNPKVSISVKDSFTGKVYEYETIKHAAKALGCHPGTVAFSICRNGKIRCLMNRYLVIVKGQHFPNVSIESIVQARPVPKRSVLGFHEPESKWVIFGSVREFIRVSRLSKKKVWRRLNNNKLEFLNGWVFAFIDSSSKEASMKIKTFIEKCRKS